MVTLKELGAILRGSTKFELQARIDGEVKVLDEVLPYEIQYLPYLLAKRNVIELDLDDKFIFLDYDTTDTKTKDIKYSSKEEDYSLL